ncbi:MAG: flagellin lysine-N-methylase [Eubacterium sp.]|nr:flagellin lysine-N-methylase [Eubacterium sp.]
MVLVYPSYYDDFHCIADRCEDTCCAGWEIDIDDDTYDKYMSVGGDFGARLIESIKTYGEELEKSGENKISDNPQILAYGESQIGLSAVDVKMKSSEHKETESGDGVAEKTDVGRGSEDEGYELHGFRLTDDLRCPFLDDHNLCDIYKELGESALCEVCTNTPRNYLEYCDRREISISASCPEAARLIYGSPEKITFICKDVPGRIDVESDEEETELGEFLIKVRDEAIRILQDRSRSLSERIGIFMKHSEAVQEAINNWESSGKALPDGVTSVLSDVHKSKDEGVDVSVPSAGCGQFDEASDAINNKDYQNKIYREFLTRMSIYSGLASIGDRWADRVQLLFELFIGDEESEGIEGLCEDQDECDDLHGDTDGVYEGDKYPDYVRDERYRDVYLKAISDLSEYMLREDRLYEYEHLLVYYAFLLLNRSIDDYDYLTKAKLVVMSYYMNRDMDAETFLRKGELTREDRQENARIYAREVEHAEENMADLEEELMFS